MVGAINHVQQRREAAVDAGQAFAACAGPALKSRSIVLERLLCSGLVPRILKLAADFPHLLDGVIGLVESGAYLEFQIHLLAQVLGADGDARVHLQRKALAVRPAVGRETNLVLAGQREWPAWLDRYAGAERSRDFILVNGAARARIPQVPDKAVHAGRGLQLLRREEPVRGEG